MIAKTILASAFVALAIVAQAAAQTFEDGQTAHDRRDFSTALEIWKSLAERGDSAAQYSIGAMYTNGEGVAQSYSEALKWFRLSASQGYVKADTALGNF